MPTDQPAEPQERLTLQSLDALKVYFDPMRMRIVEAVAHTPRTVHEIANVLDVPFTRLYYHIKMLEKHGIIRVVETRAMAGAVEEKYYRVTARQFVVDRSLLTVVDEAEQTRGLDVILSTTLMDTVSDIHRNVQNGQIDLTKEAPDPAALLIRRGILALSPEQAYRFQLDLLSLVNRYMSTAAGDGASDYAVVFSIYPTDLSTLPSDDDPDAGEGMM